MSFFNMGMPGISGGNILGGGSNNGIGYTRIFLFCLYVIYIHVVGSFQISGHK